MKDDKQIFRQYISLNEAIIKINKLLDQIPTQSEKVPIEKSLDNMTYEDIISKIDSPPFDKALMDGYAVRAQDTFGADESRSKKLKLIGKIEAGDVPNFFVENDTAVEISTGAPLPKGANSVVMIEHVKKNRNSIEIFKSVVPNENMMETGSDLRTGEIILRKGQKITAKDLGLLAAVGIDRIKVYKKPNIAIISTGNELIPPSEPITNWKIFDINSGTLIGAIMEAGGIPISLGIVRDNIEDLRKRIVSSLQLCDIIITSGGTSTGARDYMFSLMEELGDPGVVVSGISIKPGKPTIVAMVGKKIIFCLPGNPTSALAIFHLIVRPVISRLAGYENGHEYHPIDVTMKSKVYSAKGRIELLPVHLLTDKDGNYAVHPTYGNSASISTFAMADGFLIIPENLEIVEENEQVKFFPFTRNFKPADIVFMGSHCLGLDRLISLMRSRDKSIKVKSIYIGSLGGLNSIKKREADIAGIHILDESSKQYNKSILEKYELSDKAVLIRGYTREQGFIFKKGNPKGIESFNDLIEKNVTFINRNIGSGTRILIDKNLNDLAKQMKLDVKNLISQIEGYHIEAKSHSAVAAAINQDKADVGIGIKTVAEAYDLGFLPTTNENYDFLINNQSLEKRSVKIFLEVLGSKKFKEVMIKEFNGLEPMENTGRIIDS
jgi:putative molybdopterin biosynthesis protein